jgi:hypothetical protein
MLSTDYVETRLPKLDQFWAKVNSGLSAYGDCFRRFESLEADIETMWKDLILYHDDFGLVRPLRIQVIARGNECVLTEIANFLAGLSELGA